MTKLGAFALSIVLLGVGCVQREPPGPAERIGRGIDEITRALDDMNTGEVATQNRARGSSVDTSYGSRYDDRSYDRRDELRTREDELREQRWEAEDDERRRDRY